MTISSPHPIQSLRFSLAAVASLLLLVLTPSLFSQAKPEPDVIIFTNGDQLTGTVERGVGDSVVFKSDMAGEITVPYASIKELHAHGAFALLRKDTKTLTTNVQEGTVAYADSKVTLTVPTGGTESVGPKDVGYLIDKPTYDKQLLSHPGLLTGWKGAISGGATFVRSTQNGSTFNVGTTLVRAIPLVPYLPPKARSTFFLSETYGKLSQRIFPQTTPPTPDTVVKTNIFHTGFEQDRYLSPRFYILGEATFDHDYSQGLRLQQVYGGGAGITVIQQPKQQLDFKGNIHYEKQSFEVAASNQNLIGATVSELYHRNLYKGILFNENVDILPAFNNVNAYSGDANASLVLPVYKRLGVNVSGSDNFLNDPPPGSRKNSFQFSTGITYTLP